MNTRSLIYKIEVKLLNFKNFYICIGILVLVILVYCTKEKTFTVETLGGNLKVVHNLKPQFDEPVAKLELNQKIGELEPEDDNYMFSCPLSTVRDKENIIYILDNKDFCIKKFSPEGKFIKKIGRQGQGPVEFQYPYFLDIDGDENLYVFEFSTIQTLSKEGKFVNKVVLPQMGAFFYEAMNDGNIAAMGMDPQGENSAENLVFTMFDPQGNVLFEFGEPFLLETVRETWRANFCRIAVDENNNLYTTFINQNRIEKYSPNGTLIWKSERPLNFELKYETEMVKQEIQGRTFDMPEYKFTGVSRGLGFDHEGRLWVLANKAQLSEGILANEFLHFEIYDMRGVLLSYVPLPAELEKFDNFNIYREMIYFNDPYGEVCVHEYKIVDN